jgi:integrase
VRNQSAGELRFNARPNSWLAQAGTPLNVLQELGGWESESMVRRYAHLAPAQLVENSEKVAGMLGGTNTAQGKPTSHEE